jgi:hypothetical protein
MVGHGTDAELIHEQFHNREAVILKKIRFHEIYDGDGWD